ncbi:MAG: hypothetical protein HY868_06980 [Chloroflexi bacterium]|nr:hypothetical protein [Chloroflexota bacterium]
MTDAFGLIPGPDGNTWFFESIKYATEYRIAKATRDGIVTEFPITGKPIRMVSAPDGTIWFTRSGDPTIARITPAGLLTEFALPNGNEKPFGITLGPDGNLWITESTGNQILRIGIDGVVSGQFPIPTSSSNSTNIVAGHAGNLWFLENGDVTARKIGRVTPSGTITEFPLATTAYLRDIVAGSDGNIWFTEDVACVPYCATSYYTKVYPDGSYARFGPVSPIRAIATGADGNLWAISQYRFWYTLAQIKTDGTLTEFCPLVCQLLYNLGHSITTGADGKIWLTDEHNGFALATFAPQHAGTCLLNLPQVCK